MVAQSAMEQLMSVMIILNSMISVSKIEG